MADQSGESIGDISVTLVGDDSQLEGVLSTAEGRVKDLESRVHTVRLKIEGGDDPKLKKPTTTTTKLELEKDSEEKLRGKLKGIEVPISFVFAEGTIKALKQQLTEAFANFQVNIKVGAEGDKISTPLVPGTSATAPTKVVSAETAISADIPDARLLRRVMMIMKRPEFRAGVTASINQAKTSIAEPDTTPAEKKKFQKELDRAQKIDTLISTAAIGTMPTLATVQKLSPKVVAQAMDYETGRPDRVQTILANRRARTQAQRIAMELVPEPTVKAPVAAVIAPAPVAAIPAEPVAAIPAAPPLSPEAEKIRAEYWAKKGMQIPKVPIGPLVEEMSAAEADRLARVSREMAPQATVGPNKFAPRDSEQGGFFRGGGPGVTTTSILTGGEFKAPNAGPVGERYTPLDRLIGISGTSIPAMNLRPSEVPGFYQPPESISTGILKSKGLQLPRRKGGPLIGTRKNFGFFDQRASNAVQLGGIQIQPEPGGYQPVGTIRDVEGNLREGEFRGASVGTGTFDIRGPYPQDPILAEISRKFLQAGYGTPEEPYTRNPETKKLGQRLTTESPLREFMVANRISTSLKGAAKKRQPFLGPKDEPLAIVQPRTLAMEDLRRMTGGTGELNPDDIDTKKFEAILSGKVVRELGAPGGGTERQRPRDLLDQGAGYVGTSQGGLPLAVRSENDTVEGNLANQRRIERARLRHTLRYSMTEEERAHVMTLPVGKRQAYIESKEPDSRANAREAGLRLSNPARYGPTYPALDAIMGGLQGPNPASIEGLRPEFYPRNERGLAPFTVASITRSKLRQAEHDFRSQYEDLHRIGAHGEFVPTGNLPTAFRESVSAIHGAVRDRAEAIKEAETTVGAKERTNLTRPNRTTFDANRNELANVEARLRELIGNPPELTGRQPLNSYAIPKDSGVPELVRDVQGRPVQTYRTQLTSGRGATLASGRRLAPNDVADELGRRIKSRVGSAPFDEPRTFGKLGLAEGYMDNPEVAQLFARQKELIAAGISSREAAPTPLGNKIAGGTEFANDVRATAAGKRAIAAPTAEEKTLGARDTYAEALAGSSFRPLHENEGTVGQEVAASIEERRQRMRAGEAAPEPTPIGPAIEERAAGRMRAANGRFQKAAEEREPALPPTEPPGAGRTTLTPGGGVVPVHVVNFAELKGMGVSGGPAAAKRPAKISEIEEDIDPAGIRKAAATVKGKYPLMEDKRLADLLVRKGFDRGSVEETLGITKPTPTARATSMKVGMAKAESAIPGLQYERYERSPNVKSDARIASEAAILEARSLNPTRAFTTAVGATFAKTFGGGGQFEVRVRELTRALNVQGDFKEKLEDIDKALAVNSTNLKINADFAEKAGQMPAGPERTKQLDILAERETGFEAERKQLRAQRPEAAAGVAAADQDVAERRRNLISPLGVVKGFAALGVGAIAGGMIFQAASAALGTVAEEIVKAGGKVTDALSGFAGTAGKLNTELSQAVRGAGGNVPGAIAGQLAGSGISAQLFAQLGGPLGGRAGALSATQNLYAISDAERTANFNQGGQRAAYDKALFQGTGGLFDSGIMGQQGLLEAVFGRSPADQPFANTGIDVLQAQAQQKGGMLGDSESKALGIVGAIPFLGDALNQAGNMGGAKAPFVEDLAKKQTVYYGELNRQLEKANSGFKFLTNATDAQKTAMIDSAAAISDEAKKRAEQLAGTGVAITGLGGQGLTGTQFGQASQDLAAGLNQVDKTVAYQQDKRAIDAQMASLDRQQQRQLQFSIPVSRGMAQFANPEMPANTGLTQLAAPAGGLSSDQNAQLQKTQGLIDQINQRAEAGRKIMATFVPVDMMDRLTGDMNAIQGLNETMAKAQSVQTAAEYANQLRIAQRSYQDIAGLVGGIAGTESSQLGVLERQNLLLGRRAQMIGFELQQRQINLQVALAGFQTPGQTSEERGARRADAEAQAKFAQEQLDIQKQMFGNQVKVVDISNLRQATDLLHQISLLKSGYALQINMKIWNDQKQKIEQDVAATQAEVQTYINRNESQYSILENELGKLEAAYGKFVNDTVASTIAGIQDVLNGVATAIGSTSAPGVAGNDARHAAGALFNTGGPTSMVVGEAGTETVAVLRNPRNVSPTSMGGGVTININNPIVRADNDIAKIARAVEDVLNRKTQLMGLR